MAYITVLPDAAWDSADYPAVYVFKHPYVEGDCPLFGGVLSNGSPSDMFWETDDYSSRIDYYNSHSEIGHIIGESYLIEDETEYDVRIYDSGIGDR